MTDTEQPHPVQGIPGAGPSSRRDDEPYGGARISEPMVPRRKNSDPTDPEVPSAKRRRAQGRRRFMFMTGSMIGALVLIVVSLLYKIGRQVTDAPTRARPTSEDGTSMPSAEMNAPSAPAPPALTVQPAPRLPGALPLASSSLRKEEAPPGEPPSKPAHATGNDSARPKGSGSDIFRTPSF